MKLKAKARKDLPKADFAGSDRSFPIENKEHARLAIGAATRSEHAGHISLTQADKIKAKARKKLGLINSAAYAGSAGYGGGDSDDGSDDAD